MNRLFIVVALLALSACAQQPPPPPPVAANPPPPPPAPPTPTTFSVYFDYNSAQLGPEAREIVRLAADGYKSGNPGSVQVAGYTDAAGSAGYNQRLSLRRANAIAAELQRDGVPQGIIIVGGRGESSNAPNPGQDRRVDITLGGPPSAAPSS